MGLERDTMKASWFALGLSIGTIVGLIIGVLVAAHALGIELLPQTAPILNGGYIL